MLKAGGEMLDKVMFEEIIHPEKWINECYKELMEKEWNNEIERCRRHTESVNQTYQ